MHGCFETASRYASSISISGLPVSVGVQAAVQM